MKFHGNQTIKFADLNLPDDFDERMASAPVQALAASIESTGLINVPMVRIETMTVIAGRDRAAASRLTGATAIEVRPVSCTDAEAEIIEITENFRRRRYTQAEADAALARLVALEMAANQAVLDSVATMSSESQAGETSQSITRKSVPKRGKGGQSKGAKAAVAKVAKDQGKSVRTVQRAVAKTKKAAAPPKTAAPPPPIELHGFPIATGILDKIRELVTMLGEGDRKLRDVQSLLTRLESNGLPMDPPLIDRLRRETQALASSYRAAMPVEICNFCKCHIHLLGDCPSCGGSGYSYQRQIDSMPKELKVWSPLNKVMVTIHGKLKRYVDVDATDGAF